jgi:hypothetical protein
MHDAENERDREKYSRTSPHQWMVRCTLLDVGCNLDDAHDWLLNPADTSAALNFSARLHRSICYTKAPGPAEEVEDADLSGSGPLFGTYRSSPGSFSGCTYRPTMRTRPRILINSVTFPRNPLKSGLKLIFLSPATQRCCGNSSIRRRPRSRRRIGNLRTHQPYQVAAYLLRTNVVAHAPSQGPCLNCHHSSWGIRSGGMG